MTFIVTLDRFSFSGRYRCAKKSFTFLHSNKRGTAVSLLDLGAARRRKTLRPLTLALRNSGR
jgi:hypothetical protein